MQAVSLLSVVFAFLFSQATGARDLSISYPFHLTLNTEEKGGLYELYWRFDNEDETIDFAVRVQTTGWVGFGLSPNGQMPNSDVVIGWVENNEAFLHDRFATVRATPPIDVQQDWFLTEGEEENGFTTLEFTRNFTTCDSEDLAIQADTARVIWSFHPSDPSSAESVFMEHSHKGSRSVNLLGGLSSAAPDPDDLAFFDLRLDNIEIPSADTTYWCATFLVKDLIDQKVYITKYAPVVTEGNEAHVHHLVVYRCDNVTNSHALANGVCTNTLGDRISRCQGLLAAWAVGGDDFRYPDNAAFPLGGSEGPEFLVAEVHYDNPNMVSGTQDSSGLRFFYTRTPREHDAGILLTGHDVNPYLIIPPNTPNYTVTATCIADCTNEYFPKEGIHVFANMLHAHTASHGLILQHLRYNSECNEYEELEPIDSNLRYDFNFQQFTQLSRTTTVLPGDILLLKCFYDNQNTENVTVGGLSTHEEMCLTFPVYYPKVPLSVCVSSPNANTVNEYVAENFPNGTLELLSEGRFQQGLSNANWNDEMVQSLRSTVMGATQTSSCIASDGGVSLIEKEISEVGCTYIPPDTCTGYTPPACCERVREEGSGEALGVSLSALLLLTIATLLV